MPSLVCYASTTSEVYATIDENYRFGDYTGLLTPSPPHADNNPARAVVVTWNDKPYKFVFWHEAAYTPFWELSDGSGLTCQYFEGEGDTEGDLWCPHGRKESVSNVALLENGPNRVHVRWWYNPGSVTAQEDYYFYPNGLCWRKMKVVGGESNECFEMMIMNRVGDYYRDNVPGPENGIYKLVTMLDVYSFKKREYWDDKSKTGASKSEIEDAAAKVFRVHLNDLDPFAIYGDGITAFIGTDDKIVEIWDSWAYKHHFTCWPIGWSWSTSEDGGFGTYPSVVCPIGLDSARYSHAGDSPMVWLFGVSDAPDDELRELAKAFVESPDVMTNPDVVKDLPYGPQDNTCPSIPGNLSAVADGQKVDLILKPLPIQLITTKFLQ